MNTKKNLGIWMDHATAHIIEYSNDATGNETVESKFTHEVKEQSFSKSEGLEHNKEQHQQASYYKQIAEVIKGYDHVLLFGPTDAKAELFNTLKSDHHFDKIKIEMESADKMTEPQQHAFVREHFAKHNQAL